CRPSSMSRSTRFGKVFGVNTDFLSWPLISSPSSLTDATFYDHCLVLGLRIQPEPCRGVAASQGAHASRPHVERTRREGRSSRGTGRSHASRVRRGSFAQDPPRVLGICWFHQGP